MWAGVVCSYIGSHKLFLFFVGSLTSEEGGCSGVLALANLNIFDHFVARQCQGRAKQASIITVQESLEAFVLFLLLSLCSAKKIERKTTSLVENVSQGETTLSVTRYVG